MKILLLHYDVNHAFLELEILSTNCKILIFNKCYENSKHHSENVREEKRL